MNKTAEQYIAVLYNLASNCDYGEMQNQMIRDHLVVGIRANSVSERLQMDPEITLEKAKKQSNKKKLLKGTSQFWIPTQPPAP